MCPIFVFYSVDTRGRNENTIIQFVVHLCRFSSVLGNNLQGYLMFHLICKGSVEATPACDVAGLVVGGGWHPAEAGRLAGPCH